MGCWYHLANTLKTAAPGFTARCTKVHRAVKIVMQYAPEPYIRLWYHVVCTDFGRFWGIVQSKLFLEMCDAGFLRHVFDFEVYDKLRN